MPKSQGRKCGVFVLGTYMGSDNILEDGGNGRGERKDFKLITAFRLTVHPLPSQIQDKYWLSLEVPCNLSSDLLEPGTGPRPATHVCIALKLLLAL